MKTAKEEFEYRFPETWESFTNKQKKHVVYVINGYASDLPTLDRNKVRKAIKDHIPICEGGFNQNGIERALDLICSLTVSHPISDEEISDIIYKEFKHGGSGAFTICADRAATTILKELGLKTD